MFRKSWIVGLVIAASAANADAQVVSGVMSVTQSHMS
jgi:hypothetical protein